MWNYIVTPTMPPKVAEQQHTRGMLCKTPQAAGGREIDLGFEESGVAMIEGSIGARMKDSGKIMAT
jgi:hypothetical protein